MDRNVPFVRQKDGDLLLQPILGKRQANGKLAVQGRPEGKFKARLLERALRSREDVYLRLRREATATNTDKIFPRWIRSGINHHLEQIEKTGELRVAPTNRKYYDSHARRFFYPEREVVVLPVATDEEGNVLEGMPGKIVPCSTEQAIYALRTRPNMHGFLIEEVSRRAYLEQEASSGREPDDHELQPIEDETPSHIVVFDGEEVDIYGLGRSALWKVLKTEIPDHEMEWNSSSEEDIRAALLDHYGAENHSSATPDPEAGPEDGPPLPGEG